MAVSPTDASNYVGPDTSKANPADPGYPKWLYHPTLDAVIVVDSSAENALRSQDPLWSTAPYAKT